MNKLKEKTNVTGVYYYNGFYVIKDDLGHAHICKAEHYCSFENIIDEIENVRSRKRLELELEVLKGLQRQYQDLSQVINEKTKLLNQLNDSMT